MTISFDEWVAAHEGVTTDVDGYFGGQCWDLWSSYAQEVCGVPQSATNTTSGYADSVYTVKYGQTAALQETFDKIGPDETAQKGDVAFWSYGSSYYPTSHVAIVLADQGSSVLCLSQNPGAPKRMSLTKNGLCGYFRPREMEDDMSQEDVDLIKDKTIKTNDAVGRLEARPTHIVFQTGNALGIANVAAGTYEIFESENAWNVRRMMLERTGNVLREWREYTADKTSNVIREEDLSGFGVRIGN